MSDRAQPKEKKPSNRQAAAEDLAATIKNKVESLQAAIKGDTSVPLLTGICQSLNDVVPKLVKEMKHSHSTAGLARDLSVCSHVLLTASREAALKFQKKNMIAGKTEEEVHADELMKFICTHYVALDGKTITSAVKFPVMKDGPKSKDSTKKRKTGLTKDHLEKKIRLQIEDIGFGLGGGSKDYSEIPAARTSARAVAASG